jgi:hypothetical protein
MPEVGPRPVVSGSPRDAPPCARYHWSLRRDRRRARVVVMRFERREGADEMDIVLRSFDYTGRFTYKSECTPVGVLSHV